MGLRLPMPSQTITRHERVSMMSPQHGAARVSPWWQDRTPQEIARSSANMHMIPATDDVAAALAGVRKGDRVRIDGWLVEAHAADGWRWRSSTRRDDSGGGACEVVYVCAITRL